MGVFYEAKHSLIRTTIAKLVAVLTIIDDIYDSFGTLPELKIFTRAIERFQLLLIYKFSITGNYFLASFTYLTKSLQNFKRLQKILWMKYVLCD